MRWLALVITFLAGSATATLAAFVIHITRAPAGVIPDDGVLYGWTVVRDDETLVCESPAIFVAAKQIECP
jgi:hypothetical protein